ncbi:hypothetical protein [uncultured Eudoraea sp.]|jgi:mannose-6-phosphate isomerase-like protein (cupin superfamily)|uniref:cupin domain-containing protein n=1 Tax=uncultured Eudoraea sp. TaxID=1035614 RepID=UPI00261F7FC8|nr:hypothetical protein [uncultured Eudoraea sp.]
MRTKIKTSKKQCASLLLSAAFYLLVYPVQSQENSKEHHAILQSFVESYKTDPMALSVTFGIAVGEEWWHVVSERKEEGYKVGKKKQYTFHNYGPNEVTLHQGKPKEPTWYFKFADASVLQKINAKVWTASTANARSTSADEVGLDILSMDGFIYTQKTDAISYQVLEHFWKKDAIEITHFTRDNTLPSHGAEIVSLYTMKDKRIGWFSLGTDEAANADERLEKGQVPNLMIFTKGKGKGLFGEEEFDIEPGMSVFIGPYVKHVIYNPYEEPLEGILVLFGDNIDFAKGQSYLEFLEREQDFLEENEKNVQISSGDLGSN